MTRPEHIAAALIAAAAIITAGCLGLGQTRQSSMETISGESGGITDGWANPARTRANISCPIPTASDKALAQGSVDQCVGARIIKTGRIRIDVPWISTAINQIRDIATSNGGYLTSNVYTSNDRRTVSALVWISPERFDQAMEAIGSLGKVSLTFEELSDVTEEYTNLTIQNESYYARLENYDRLLARATDEGESIKIQAQIDQITLSIKQIERTLRNLEPRATIEVIIWSRNQTRESPLSLPRSLPSLSSSSP